jgi:REP element-mobilizing transposase RayT
MSYVKVFIHAVWGTKSKIPFIKSEIRPEILSHIKQYAKEKGIFVDEINAYQNHVHCLFRLNADMTVAKVLNLLKGESSFWINKQKLLKQHFSWADEYYAASVCENDLIRVRNYIRHQDEHHHKMTFTEAYLDFMKTYIIE